MTRLPPRTTMTTDDMPLSELLRPISARVLPQCAFISDSGERIDEVTVEWVEARSSRSGKARARASGRI